MAEHRDTAGYPDATWLGTIKNTTMQSIKLVGISLLTHKVIDQVGKSLVNGLQSSNSHHDVRSEFELHKHRYLFPHFLIHIPGKL